MSKEVKGFVARVLALVKGGDEGKITRFQAKTVKFCNKQIKLQNDVIEGLKDELADVQEAASDALVAVDMKSIDTAQGTNDYIPTYLFKMKAFDDKEKAINDKIEDCNEQIAKFKAVIARVS